MPNSMLSHRFENLLPACACPSGGVPSGGGDPQVPLHAPAGASQRGGEFPDGPFGGSEPGGVGSTLAGCRAGCKPCRSQSLCFGIHMPARRARRRRASRAVASATRPVSAVFRSTRRESDTHLHPYGMSAEDIAAPFDSRAARAAPAIVSGILVVTDRRSCRRTRLPHLAQARPTSGC